MRFRYDLETVYSLMAKLHFQDYMKQITGGRSVPRVFIGGKFIGGGDEPMTAHKSGNLQKMLTDSGAI